MANYEKQYAAALRNWDQLHEDNLYSDPSEQCATAIVCSLVDLSDDKKPCGRSRKDIKIFRNEALAIADRLRCQGKLAEVAINASSTDFESILKDPHYDSVQVIGHGNLSAIILNDGSDDWDHFDWKDVSIQSDHLKQGIFIQRMCGNIARGLTVPLGSFAMADHQNVFAPVGISFEPRGLDHPACNALMSVADGPRMDYDYIRSTFQ